MNSYINDILYSDDRPELIDPSNRNKGFQGSRPRIPTPSRHSGWPSFCRNLPELTDWLRTGNAGITAILAPAPEPTQVSFCRNPPESRPSPSAACRQPRLAGIRRNDVVLRTWDSSIRRPGSPRSQGFRRSSAFHAIPPTRLVSFPDFRMSRIEASPEPLPN
jgi:hypothetical protein